MLGSWFTAKAQKDGHDEDGAKESSSALRRLSVSHRENPDLGSPPPALSNPHDAILAELAGRTGNPVPSLKSSTGVQQGPSAQHVQQGHALSNAPSALTAPTPIPETIYDPFTGVTLGTIHASASTAIEDPDATRNDIWSHLSRIRELQSDIAAKHVAMEKIGQPDGKRNRKAKDERIVTAARRLRERESVWDTEGEGEGEGEGETESELNTNKEKKKAKDQEFDRLADRFNGRKDAINDIMNKLDELSQAVTAFHALRTPTIDFTASRANTATSDPTPTTSPIVPTQTSPVTPMSAPTNVSDMSSTPNPLARSDDITSSNATPYSSNNPESKPERPLLPIFLTQLGDDHPVLLDSPSSMDANLSKAPS